MLKKILIILLFVICIGAGGYGTYHFYSENENQIAMNAQLTQQNASIQSQLDAIGQMGVAYEVNTRALSGRTIVAEDLKQVSIPISAMGDSSVSDINELIGRCYKVDINPGTILTRDMLMDEEETVSRKKYNREVEFSGLPMGMLPGDYFDIRLALANGEEYTVLTHIKADYIDGSTISFRVSEEENLLINSLLQDMANYPSTCVGYITRYIEPGLDTETVPFYPVQNDIESFITGNPNIKDTTRILNRNIREHIDEILLVYSTSANTNMSSTYIANFKNHIDAGSSMRDTWISENTDDDGNITVEVYDENANAGGTTQGGQSFQQTVGEAVDSLQQSTEEIGGIN